MNDNQIIQYNLPTVCGLLAIFNYTASSHFNLFMHIGQCQVTILPQKSADKKDIGRLSAVDRPVVGR